MSKEPKAEKLSATLQIASTASDLNARSAQRIKDERKANAASAETPMPADIKAASIEFKI